MKIYLANREDALQIAKIHKQEINQGFLNQLGLKFLSKLYEAMILSKNSFVVVAKENNQIIGFISGCANTKKFCKYFIRKHFFQVLFVLLSKITNFKEILEILKYSQENKNLPKAELSSVAIKKEYQGEGVAQKIFRRFVQEMQKRRIKKFKVAVGENLPRAIRFYQKAGFKFHSSIAIHKNQLSRIYIYDQKTF